MRGKAAVEFSKEARERAVASLKQYAAENLDDAMGDLKAGLFLDFILQEFGPTIYNRAIADARGFFEERAADLDGVCYRAEFPYWSKP